MHLKLIVSGVAVAFAILSALEWAFASLQTVPFDPEERDEDAREPKQNGFARYFSAACVQSVKFRRGSLRCRGGRNYGSNWLMSSHFKESGMRPKSWLRNFRGEIAISEAGVRTDGLVAIWVAGHRKLITETEWAALPIYR